MRHRRARSENDAIDLHRLLDILQFDLADRRQGVRDLVVHLIEDLPGDSDSARTGQGLDPRGNIYAIAHNIFALKQHIAQMYADANLK